MVAYKLIMLTELCASSVEHTIQAETDEDAIRQAESDSDTVPRLICMDLYREDGTLVKHWGA
jgi:hypothetical protein